jgi:hypothetical protein
VARTKAEKKDAMSENTTALPPSMPLPVQIEHLLGKIRRLEHQLLELSQPTPAQTAEQQTEDRRQAKAARQRDRDQRNREDAERTIMMARAAAIRALVKLLPKAIAQANAGKPALLRLILRSTK